MDLLSFSVLCLLCPCACLFICTLWTQGGVGAVGLVWTVQWGVLLNVPGWFLFCYLFSFFCLVFAVSLCASVCVCFVVTAWGRGWPLGSRLWYLTVRLSLFHWYSGSSVVLDCMIPDLCTLTYFVVTCWERADLFALVCGVLL